MNDATLPEVLQRDVAALIASGRGQHRSFSNVAALERAAAFISSQWEDAGFAVVEQPFEVTGSTYKNLLISYGPTAAPVVVVGAHYDVCGPQDGADDNASGVAALLALARRLASEQPQLHHRLELVAFALEEPPFFKTPHMGSVQHARSLTEDNATVTAMIALDLIGYFSDAPGSQRFPLPLMQLAYPSVGNFISVVGNLGNRRLVARVKTLMAASCAVPVFSISAPAIMPGIDLSDHQSYWQQGFPAVLITDTAMYRNPHYHLASDTVDTLDYPRMAEVVKGVYGAMIAL